MSHAPLTTFAAQNVVDSLSRDLLLWKAIEKEKVSRFCARLGESGGEMGNVCVRLSAVCGAPIARRQLSG